MDLDKSLWRERVRGVVPYEPGKPIADVAREFGLTDIVKIASNENPLGPSPLAIRAVSEALAQLHVYPDAAGYYVREKIGAKLDLPMDQVVLGCGTDELISIVTQAFLEREEAGLTGDQAFFSYRLAIELADARLVSLPMPDMQYDIDGMLRAMQEPGVKLVFLANPNNPTGTMVGPDDLARIVEALGPRQILVIDEAYCEYITRADFPDSLRYVRAGKNVIVLRTLSKAYGLAGLRIGYAVGRRDLVAAMLQVKKTFNVNNLAQVAAIAALDDEAHLRRTLALNQAGKERLYAFLDRLGVPYWRSEANFVLVDLRRDAQPVFQAMLRRGVIVRPLRGYGLPTCVRVSIGTPAEMERFEEAFQAVVGEGA